MSIIYFCQQIPRLRPGKCWRGFRSSWGRWGPGGPGRPRDPMLNPCESWYVSWTLTFLEVSIIIPITITSLSHHYLIISSLWQVMIIIITIPGLYKAICLLHWLKCRISWCLNSHKRFIGRNYIIFLTISIIPWLSHDYPMIIPWLSHSIPYYHILFP